MADFQEQVMGMTGLTIDNSSTTPSRAEFSQFLNDGVLEVTNRCITLKPQDKNDFTRVSSLQVANATLDLNGAEIISVVRADGSTASNFRPCSKIEPSLQSQVTDVDSLSYASKYHPVYMVYDNGTISVFPVAADDSGKDSFKVYYVNNSPAETDGSALDHASTGIKYFPSDKIYLVILYAAIKSLEAKMAEYLIEEEDSELVQATTANLNALKQQYQNAFSIMAPQQMAPSQ